MIPEKYRWLEKEPGPKMIIEGLKLVGIKEIPGKASNPKIIQMAAELGMQGKYNNDDTAWCGLSHAYVALKAGKTPLQGWDMLRALKWAEWGEAVTKPMLGDTLVFKRPGGGHVGLYVGEDQQCFHVLGGNQSNAYGFARIAKGRLVAARRPHYNNQPENVRRIILEATGEVSKDEA